MSRALDSVLWHNHRAHFNHVRSYALNEEAGLLVCSFPRGDRRDGRCRNPFDEVECASSW